MDTASLQHFWTHGWVRLERAVSLDAAAAMRDVVWRELADFGIDRDDASTWTVERPAHLQRLKEDAAFAAVGSGRLFKALDAIFDGAAYPAPKNWGALFAAFPTAAAWRLPTEGWHIDAYYGGALRPTGGVKIHMLLGDVEERGGGSLVLGGSHRLIHSWFQANPPDKTERSAQLRRSLRSHPYIAALHAPGDPVERITRFMDRTEVIDGVALRVVENYGRAGDVIFLHPLALHAASTNASKQPRFLLSGGVTTDDWGWRSHT